MEELVIKIRTRKGLKVFNVHYYDTKWVEKLTANSYSLKFRLLMRITISCNEEWRYRSLEEDNVMYDLVEDCFDKQMIPEFSCTGVKIVALASVN
jgi:hypothetical protein